MVINDLFFTNSKEIEPLRDYLYIKYFGKVIDANVPYSIISISSVVRFS